MAGKRKKLNGARSMGVAGKLFATLFLGAFLAGGIFFGYLLLGEVHKNYRTYSWTPTECKILESRVEQKGKGDESPYVFAVTYEYSVNSNTYTSSQPSVDGKAFSDYQKAQALVDEFPVGSQATCLVDPENPEQAVLFKGQLWIAFFLIIPLVFILIGGGGVIGVWMVKFGDEPTGPRSQSAKAPLSQKARPKFRIIQFWFFLMFLLTGLVFTWIFFVTPMLRVQSAKSWVETPCVVESSTVRSHRGDDSTTYSVDILYRYSFNGKDHKSNRYKFMGGSSSGRSSKSKIVRQYPKGTKTVCFVNPSNPSEAVLERNFTWDMLFGLIPFVFVLVGFFGLLHYWRNAPGRRKVSLKQSQAEGMRQRMDEASVSDGPVELKPKTAPLMKLFGIILFAVFWNGIVSVFLWQVIKAWQSSRGGFMEKWFLPIFLIPFVLIGLFLIVAVFQQFLSLFNPRPRLRLGSQKMALGEEVVVQWMVSGRVNVLQNFKLQLEGKEQACYRQGTRSQTDTNVFHTLEIANLTSHPDMRSGQAKVTIPLNTMHTFKGDNNKIIWTIKVSGEIKRWPDMDDEFPVEILPRKTQK